MKLTARHKYWIYTVCMWGTGVLGWLMVAVLDLVYLAGAMVAAGVFLACVREVVFSVEVRDLDR